MTLELFESRRADIKALLAREEYGYLPAFDYAVDYQTEESYSFGGSSAIFSRVLITVRTANGKHSFPLYCICLLYTSMGLISGGLFLVLLLLISVIFLPGLDAWSGFLGVLAACLGGSVAGALCALGMKKR